MTDDKEKIAEKENNKEKDEKIDLASKLNKSKLSGVEKVIKFMNKKKAEAAELDKVKQELKNMMGLLQRNQAEFDNYRKRVEKERVELIKTSTKELIIKLLPLLDNFEFAFKNSGCSEEFIKGTELIYAQFYQTLEDEGLKKIDANGKKFDPHFHEALLTGEESKKEDEIVLEEMQKGYLLGNNVIRHSKVKINKRAKK